LAGGATPGIFQEASGIAQGVLSDLAILVLVLIDVRLGGFGHHQVALLKHQNRACRDDIRLVGRRLGDRVNGLQLLLDRGFILRAGNQAGHRGGGEKKA